MIATAVGKKTYTGIRVCTPVANREPVLDAVSDAILAKMERSAPLDCERDYVIEDDLTDEEAASLNRCMDEYKAHPERFVPLEDVT